MAKKIPTPVKGAFAEQEYHDAMITRMGEIVDGLSAMTKRLQLIQAEIRKTKD